MRYRPLGQTGLDVSVLSYGASPLGSIFRDVDENEGIRCVHTSLDLGVNFIDCSPYYGHTKAETVLGKALRGVARERYFLATKVGRYGDNEFDFSVARVTRSIDESLQRLGVEHIDLIQCHDIEFGDLQQIIHETLPALENVRQSGKVRFIGITGYPLKAFREVIQQTQVDTILIYCRYSLNDTALQELLPLLEEKGVGIISASPLSMGLLTNRGAPAWHPAPDNVRVACAEAAAYCQQKGRDISELALQFALAEPRITTTIVGTANPENIRKNIEWATSPPDEELLAAVREILRPVQNLNWLSGRAENN